MTKIFEKQRTLKSELSELDTNLQKKRKDFEVETNSIMQVGKRALFKISKVTSEFILTLSRTFNAFNKIIGKIPKSD